MGEEWTPINDLIEISVLDRSCASNWSKLSADWLISFDSILLILENTLDHYYNYVIIIFSLDAPCPGNGLWLSTKPAYCTMLGNVRINAQNSESNVPPSSNAKGTIILHNISITCLVQ